MPLGVGKDFDFDFETVIERLAGQAETSNRNTKREVLKVIKLFEVK